MKIIIVGATGAGMAAAARLRRLNEGAFIVVADHRASVAGLRRLRDVYKIDVRLNTRIVWPVELTDDSLDGGGQGLLTLEDTRQGNVYEESYDKLILAHELAGDVGPPAAGGRNIFCLSEQGLDKIDAYVGAAGPKTAIITGAGIGAVHVAARLLRWGIDVTMICAGDVFPAQLDHDAACHISVFLQKNGLKIVKEAIPRAMTEVEGRVNYVCGDSLYTADIGVNCAAANALEVPAHMPYPGNTPGAREIHLDTICRDIISGERANNPALASRRGRAVADAVCGKPAPCLEFGESICLNEADILGKHLSYFGMTEKELNEKRLGYIYSIMPIPGGFLKLLYSADGTILGFVALGQDAFHFGNMAAVMVQMRRGVQDLAGLEMSPVARDLQTLGKIAQNVLEGCLQMAYWDEIRDLEQGQGVVVDVRSAGMYGLGHIPGAVNIPLSGLRENFESIDISKEVILVCEDGKDSYLAARMLEGVVPRLKCLTGGMSYYRNIAVYMNGEKYCG